jgi:hypothetical protein
MESTDFQNMTMHAKTVLQALAALLTIAIGAFLAPRLREDSIAMAGILGFVTVALLQVAAAAAASPASALSNPGDVETRSREREAAFERVMEHIVDVVKFFVSVQREYQSDLANLNKGLSRRSCRRAVRLRT